MRKISINYPIELEVLDVEGKYEGPSFLKPSTEPEYVASLIRPGDELQDVGDHLHLFNYRGNAAGSHRVSFAPPSEGAMPRNFSKPFLYAASFKEDPSLEGDFYGNSEKSVKDFISFRVQNVQGSLSYTGYRLFSFRGEMLLLLEDTVNVGQRVGRYVNIFKYDPSSKFFVFLNKFSEDPVDVQNNGGSVKRGSSDIFEHQGSLYVCFRQIDSEDVKIVFKRCKSDDLLDWETVSKVDINDTIINSSDDFRLRAKSNGNAVMFVFISTLKRYRSNNRISDLREFRSYVSFDSCKKFKSKQNSYKSIDKLSGDDYFIRNDIGEVLNYFIPYFDVAANWSSNIYNDININFDLYYDQNMGSFVILKGGDTGSLKDTEGFPNEAYLMGVKTNDASFMDWEPCLRLPIDSRVTGSAPSLTATTEDPELFSPYSEEAYLKNPKTYCYKIKDVCIVQGETLHDLFLSVQEANAFIGQFPPINENSAGVVSTEFSFVDDNLVASGFYDQVQAYGGKYHSKYSFFSSLINCEIGGLSSIGYRTSGNKPLWADPTACKWRNQLVAMARQTSWPSPKFMTVLGPISNLGEIAGYEFSYSPYIGSFQDIGLSYFGSNYTVEYDEANGTKFNYSASASFGHVEMPHYPSNISNYQAPDVSRTPLRRIGESKFKYFKVKLRFRFDGFGSLVTGQDFSIMEMFVSPKAFSNSDSNMRFKLFLMKNSTGKYNLYVDGVFPIMESFDFSAGVWYDLLICNIDPNNNSQSDFKLRFYAKESDSFEWKFIDERMTLFQSSPPMDDGYLRIGVLSAIGVSPGANSSFSIKDLFISTYGTGYRTIYSSSKYPDALNVEPHNFFGSEMPFPTCLPTKAYSRDIELSNGALVRIDGGRIESGLNSFSLSRALTRNTPANVVNGLANSTYDFTRTYDQDQEAVVIFRNVYKDKADVLSLVNVNGIYGFDIRSGNYNESLNTWTNQQDQSYTVPYVELELVSQDDDFIIVDQQFEPSQLVGHSLFSFNEVSFNYENHFIVLENFNDVIKLDRQLPNLAGKKLRLVKNSMSFLMPPALGVECSHYMLSFFSSDISPLRSIGEIVIGRWIDLSDIHIEMSDSLTSNTATLESQRGNLFPGRVDKGNVHTETKIKFSNLSKPKGEYDEMVNLLFSLYRREKPFPFIEYHNDGQLTTFGTIAKSIQVSPETYYHSIDMEVFLQHWRAVSNDTYVEALRDFRISASSYLPIFNQTLGLSETVTFMAVARNFGSIAGYSFVWDFGDGSPEETGLAVTHQYTNFGSYTVYCRLKKNDEVIGFRRLNVECGLSTVQSYVLLSTSYNPAIGNTVVFSARDANLQLAQDSFTSVTATVLEGPYDFDGDQSSTRTLYRGSVNFIVTKEPFALADPLILRLTDSNGKTSTLTITGLS